MKGRMPLSHIDLIKKQNTSKNQASKPLAPQAPQWNWKINVYSLRSYVALLESEKSLVLNVLRILEQQESSLKMISPEPLGSLNPREGAYLRLPLTLQNHENTYCKFLITKDHLTVLRRLSSSKKWMVSKFLLRAGSIIAMTLDGSNLSIRRLKGSRFSQEISDL